MARCDFVDMALEHPPGDGPDARHFFDTRRSGFQCRVSDTLLLTLFSKYSRHSNEKMNDLIGEKEYVFFFVLPCIAQ